MSGPRTELLRSVVERLLGWPIVEMIPIPRGGNNRLFVASTASAQPVLVKQYHVDARDPRDRLRTEYVALQQMRNFGIAQVPKPIAADYDSHVALYGFILGNAADEQPACAQDIDEMLALAQALRSMAQEPHLDMFGLASEAVLSPRMVLNHIYSRVQALRESSEAHLRSELLVFLEQHFLPLLDFLVSECHRILESITVPQTDLPLRQQTLSPCDFGFHNAVRQPDGALVFVDFEYFGWDDPVKMVSDVLLHPAHSLSPELQRRFFDGARTLFHDDHRLDLRLRAMFPLFGMKWVLIVLNALSDIGAARRRFAAIDPETVSANLERDLSMARKRLDSILPYSTQLARWVS